MTLLKVMTRRRRNEVLHTVNPNNDPTTAHKQQHHQRSRSQETFEQTGEDMLQKQLDKRYLSYSTSSSSTDTDDCYSAEAADAPPPPRRPNYSRAMTDTIVERKRLVIVHDENNNSSGRRSSSGAAGTVLETLARFPIAVTHDKHCWSEPNHGMYSVRGPTYLQDGEKITSGPYLLRARGADLLLSSNPPKHMGRYSKTVLGGTLRSLPTFIFKFRLPWGVLPLYFEIPAHLCPYLRPNPPPLDSADDNDGVSSWTPSERTLAKFFMASQEDKNDLLKLIPFVSEGPWVVRNLVTGKPAIIGNKLPVTYTYVPASDDGRQAEYLEADLDIASSSATAKRIVSMCRRYMNLLTVDIGLVIQGNSTKDLPEQMLGSIRLHSVDPDKAPTLV